MPAPSRDRLARPIDISTLFQGAARRVNLIVDEPGLHWAGLSGNPVRNGSGSQGIRSGGSRVGVRGGRSRIGWNYHRTLPIGRENRMAVRGRGRGGVLPSWYPRTPLRDITAIVRAIERRRAELHDDQAAEAPLEDTNTPAPSNAQLEHDFGALTPIPTLTMKPQNSSATQLRKIITNAHSDKGSGADFITPQKRLLDSIEKVREVWLEEQQKLQKTPAAKKADREKKMRTLMSMR